MPLKYPCCPAEGKTVEEIPDLPERIYDEIRDLTDPLDNGNRIILARGLVAGLPDPLVVKRMPLAGPCGFQNLNEAFSLLEMEKEQLSAVLPAAAVYKDDDHLYILMEMCTGGDLFNQLDNDADEKVLQMWATQLLQALQVLHHSGRMHGDICLENCVVASESKTLRLIDCAQLIKVHAPGDVLHEAPLPLRIRTGRALFSPPETLRPPGAPDDAVSSAFKRDMYQAGCTLFALAAQEYPFSQPLALSTARRAELPAGGCAASARKLLKRRPDASPELQDLLARLLAPSPDARPTASEALAHPWIAGPPARAQVPGPAAVAAEGGRPPAAAAAAPLPGPRGRGRGKAPPAASARAEARGRGGAAAEQWQGPAAVFGVAV